MVTRSLENSKPTITDSNIMTAVLSVDSDLAKYPPVGIMRFLFRSRSLLTIARDLTVREVKPCKAVQQKQQH